MRRHKIRGIAPTPTVRAHKQRRRLVWGFTLVELLVSISLMALVGGVCVAMLNAGLGIWQRAQDYGRYDQQVLITLEQLRRDLQRSRKFSLIPFDGRLNRFAFATVDDAGGTSAPEIGQLGYFIDYQEQVLCRSFVPYRLLRHRRIDDNCRPVLSGVHRIEFAYLVSQEGGLRWTRRWDSPVLPQAVRVSLTLKAEGQEVGPFSSIIPLMNTGGLNDES